MKFKKTRTLHKHSRHHDSGAAPVHPEIKKKYGQHFLRWQNIVDSMIMKVRLDKNTSVFEIGCGDGFLTRSILHQEIARLWVFEIDPYWAKHVETTLKDPRMTVHLDNFLDIDFKPLIELQPWTILANLPYAVTFPILHTFARHRDIIKEGVIMIQEEVAQKIVKTSGRGYGYPSLFFQRYFEWQLMDKVPPIAFEPPPKVFSRLLYFKPRATVEPIKNEENFWKFIKLCFAQPRRTLRNNLSSTHYDAGLLDEETLSLRAQQLSADKLINIWHKLQG